MKVFLKGFAEEVNFDAPEQVQHVLVLDVEGLGERRLSVPKEVHEQLIAMFYADGAGSAEATKHPDVSAGATEFGGEPAQEPAKPPAPAPDHCPQCGYPDTFDGEHYKGVYFDGKPCSYCDYDSSRPPEPPAPQSEEEVKSL